MQVIQTPNVEQAPDVIQAENELALLLEQLGGEIIAIAEELRGVVPYVAVEGRLTGITVSLSKALIVGHFIKQEDSQAAFVLLCQILEPECYVPTKRRYCPNCGHNVTRSDFDTEQGPFEQCVNCHHCWRVKHELAAV